MDRHTTLISAAGLVANRVLGRGVSSAQEPPHIVDQLIAERTTHLSRHPLWPLARPFLFRFLHYRQAVAMADEIAQMTGREAMAFVSDLLSFNISARGKENLPAK